MGPRAPGSSPSWMRATRLPERGSGHLPFPEIYYCTFNRSCESKAAGRTAIALGSSCNDWESLLDQSCLISVRNSYRFLVWWTRTINRCSWLINTINLSIKGDKSRQDTVLELGLRAMRKGDQWLLEFCGITCGTLEVAEALWPLDKAHALIRGYTKGKKVRGPWQLLFFFFFRLPVGRKS